MGFLNKVFNKNPKEEEFPSEQDVEKAFEGAQAEGLERHEVGESEKKAREEQVADAWAESAVDAYLTKNLSLKDVSMVLKVRQEMVDLVKNELRGKSPDDWTDTFENLKPDLDALNPEAEV